MSFLDLKKVELIEKALLEKKGVLGKGGNLIVETGECTGRSTKERFVVRHRELEDEIHWGEVNQPLDPQKGEEFFKKLKDYIKGKESYKAHGHVACFGVSVYSTSAWHIAFAKNMFRSQVIHTLCETKNSFRNTGIEIWHAPSLKVSELGISFPFEKAIILDFLNRRVGIVGSAYAGEIKKSAFTMCNFIFPPFGILSMHASANCEKDGSNSSVLFGLSGTGKTTLSTDPDRYLIGDDEIVWSHNGISNLEGGCYAKLIRLDQEKEPDIYKAVHQFGSILENVVFDQKTREIDFNDGSITENTRGSYSLEALNKVFDQTKEVEAPKTIIFLTADAFGALPSIARLNPWQTQFHFVSGYTAKIAGTEIGVTEPKATFSACFGAPFMPRFSSVYASLLSQFVQKNNVKVWLLNTGWTKGGYGVGQRFPISVSRTILKSIQSGKLNDLPTKTHPIFGFEVPVSIPGIDPEWLKIPKGPHVVRLAEHFVEYAKKNQKSISKEMLRQGGPRLNSSFSVKNGKSLSL